MAGKIIALVSGKGGVGKTTLAINLAHAIKTHHQKEVILLDANLHTGNAAIFLGAPSLPQTLHDVLDGKAQLKDVVYLHPSGIKLIPSGISFYDLSRSHHDKLDQVLNELRQYTDYVIVDSPSGLHENVRKIIQSSDEIIVVVTPELASLADALKVIRIAQESKKLIKGAIINKVTFDKEIEMPKEDIESILELEILGIIPSAREIKVSQVRKHPVLHTHPHSRVSQELHKTAAKIIGAQYIEPQKHKKGLFARR